MAKPQSLSKQVGMLFGLTLLKGISYLPQSVGLEIGKVIGLLTYLFSRRRRQICETNLRLAFPELDLKNVTDYAGTYLWKMVEVLSKPVGPGGPHRKNSGMG